jgi:phosphatidate phosphatase LPIN
MELVQTMVDGVAYALFLNPSTLSGAIDVVVVKHPDGSLHSTPFHVRFGKLQLLYSSEKTVRYPYLT